MIPTATATGCGPCSASRRGRLEGVIDFRADGSFIYRPKPRRLVGVDPLQLPGDRRDQPERAPITVTLKRGG